MSGEEWFDLGPVQLLSQRPLAQIKTGRMPIALTCKNGEFSAISGLCSHVGGPLGDGHLEGDYIVCPWHYWKFHHNTGKGESGLEEDCVPRYETKIENGHLFVNVAGMGADPPRSPCSRPRWQRTLGKLR